MGGDLGPLVSNQPTTPAQAHAARLTLAELALATSDDPHTDLAQVLAVLGLTGDKTRGLWLEQP